ncbi:hypothetical protein BDY19DRAFT_550058 [Irpex rosettiformis]|uniref:Uncharacterized protein n=1 Tax=Irpex rosettiformis TaxID=378272 RepID=A0ACB8TQE0_9APHY|nr:hypothetical protein BDY19DRAFT_550058 [Irpex rosettiformis]
MPFTVLCAPPELLPFPLPAMALLSRSVTSHPNHGRDGHSAHWWIAVASVGQVALTRINKVQHRLASAHTLVASRFPDISAFSMRSHSHQIDTGQKCDSYAVLELLAMPLFEEYGTPEPAV